MINSPIMHAIGQPLLPMTRELTTLHGLGAPIEAVCAAQDLVVTMIDSVRLVHGDPRRACANGGQPLGDPLALTPHGRLSFCHECQESYQLEQSLHLWMDVRRLHAELLDARALARRGRTGERDINEQAGHAFMAQLRLAYARAHPPTDADDVPQHVLDWRATGLDVLAAQVDTQRQAVLARWRTRPAGPTQRLVLFDRLATLASASPDNALLTKVRRAAAAWEPVAISATLRWMVVVAPAPAREPEWEWAAQERDLMVDLGPARDIAPRTWALVERLACQGTDGLAGAVDTAEFVETLLTAATRGLFDRLLEDAPGVPIRALPQVAQDLAAMPDPAAAAGVFVHLTRASPGATPPDLVHAVRGILAAA